MSDICIAVYRRHTYAGVHPQFLSTNENMEHPPAAKQEVHESARAPDLTNNAPYSKKSLQNADGV